MTELERCGRRGEVCCMCCPACRGLGEDYNFRCDTCRGTGRRSKMDHPLAEDARRE